MARKSRTGSTGLLHHIMCRGIERRRIFDTCQARAKTSETCALFPPHIEGLLRALGEVGFLAPVDEEFRTPPPSVFLTSDL